MLFSWVTIFDVSKGSVPFILKCSGLTIYGHRMFKIHSVRSFEMSRNSNSAAQHHILADRNSPVVRPGKDKTDFCSFVVKYEPMAEERILKLSLNSRRLQENDLTNRRSQKELTVMNPSMSL